MSAYQLFTRGSAVTLVGVLLAGVINYLTRRVLALNLSVEEYGFFYSAFSLVSLVLAMVDLGLGKSGTVLIARYDARNRKNTISLIFTMIFFLKLGIGVILCMGLMLLVPSLAYGYFTFPAGVITLYCLCLYIPLQAMGGCVVSTFGALKDFPVRTIMQTLYYMVVLLFVVIFKNQFRVLAPALAYCFAAGSIVGLGLIFLRWRHGLKLNWAKKRWCKAWPQTWKYARWLTLSVTGVAIMSYVDTLMLTRLCGLKSAAGYQVALPIAQIARSFMFLPVVFMPIAADLWRQKSLEQINNICTIVTLLMVLFVGGGMLLLFPLSGWIISFLFDKQYIWVGSTLVVLGCGMPLLVIAEFYLNTLNGIEKPRLAAYAALLGLVCNVVANLILIPRFNVLGAALATVLSFLVIIIIAYWHLQKNLDLQINWQHVFRLVIGAVIIVIALTWLVGSGKGLQGLVFWLLGLLLYLIYGGLIIRPYLLQMKAGHGS